ncbi:hypothetical protein [Alsobacter sp. R-9]
MMIVLWTVVFIAMMDIAVALLIPRPTGYEESLPPLQRYVDYGRSIEGKLRTLAGPSEDKADWIMTAGWLEKECSQDRVVPKAGQVGVSIYGNSFSLMLADHLAKDFPEFAATTYFGPAAPLSHSFACFEIQHELHGNANPVQVIGVLASSLRRMKTLTGLTTSFERPHPYTYPRYSIGSDGSLQAIWPSVRTAQDLRHALEDKAKWAAFMRDLERGDTFYSSLVMQEDIFDYSPLARLFRRGWGQSVIRSRTQALYGADGSFDEADIAPVARKLLNEFADKVLKSGQVPVVVLFEDRGYAGVMRRAFQPILERRDVIVIDSSQLVDTSDSGNFVADGHYSHAAMDRIARALAARINARMTHEQARDNFEPQPAH